MNNMIVGFNRNPKSIRIAELFIQQTGTYSNQYFRPYVSYMDGQQLNQIISRVEQMGPGAAINSNVFSGLTSNLVSPSAQVAGEVPIPNGWGETRARFILVVYVEFSTGNPIRYYIQGFTDYLGYSRAGNIDPNLTFFINSITAVSSIPVMTPVGMMEQNKVIESDLVVNDLSTGQNMYSQSKFLVRPSDIFNGIQVSDINQIDPSLMDRRSLLTMEPKSSNRLNNVPAEYISKIIDSYNRGRYLTDYGQSETDILSQAKSMILEESTSMNPFIAAISNMKGVQTTKIFQYSDLLRLDPNTDNVTKINWISDRNIGELHQAGQTEYLHGADRTTVVASSLALSIPALMMEYLLSNVTIQATNNTLNGAIEILLIPGRSLTNADTPQHYEAFKHRLLMEVINDFTWNNQTAFAMYVTCDLFGDTKVELSLDGGPLTPYVFPSFSDSLYTNVITPNQESYMGLVNAFSTLMQ